MGDTENVKRVGRPNRKSSTTQGWWTRQNCVNCGQPVRTSQKHGHYTMTADGVVTVRHTIGICTPH